MGYTIENINKSLEFFNSNPLKKNQIIGGPDQDDADSIISSSVTFLPILIMSIILPENKKGCC